MKTRRGAKAFTSRMRKKVPAMVVSGVLLVGVVGGAYYLSTKEDAKFSKTTTVSNNNNTGKTTTNSQVQQNIESKTTATTDGTTTSTTTADKPAQTNLADGSLNILLDTDTRAQAYVYFYGSAGTYGLEKLVGSSWTTVVSSFSYTGRGGSGQLDTISSSTPTTHYRVFKLENGTRTSTSNDLSISWQNILDKGTLTVSLGS